MRPSQDIARIRTTIFDPVREVPDQKSFLCEGNIFVLQIGSGENCQIKNECLANLHASIEVQKQSAYITNHDRVAGTLLNGRMIHDRVKVHHGDEIKCGEVQIDIELLEPAVTPEKSNAPTSKHRCECGIEWELYPQTCTNRAHWDKHVKSLNEALAVYRREAESVEDRVREFNDRIARVKQEAKEIEQLVEDLRDQVEIAQFEKEGYEKTLKKIATMSATCLGQSEATIEEAATWVEALVRAHDGLKSMEAKHEDE